MIGKITGTIAHKTPHALIVDVSGVGYLAHVMPHAAAEGRIGGDVELWTYLSVKENALELYGFTKREELDFFEILITISGIGPKKALQILTAAGIETLRRAAQTGEPSYLQKVSGVGKKNAEKLVMELQDRFGSLDEGGVASTDSDVFDALKGFGYTTAEINEAIRSLPPSVTDTGERIKEALKRAGK